MWQQRVRTYNARVRRLGWAPAGAAVVWIVLVGVSFFPPEPWKALSWLLVVMWGFLILMPLWFYRGNLEGSLKCPRCGDAETVTATRCESCYAPLSESVDYNAMYDRHSWRGGYVAAGTALSIVAYMGLRVLLEYDSPEVVGQDWFREIFPFGLGFRPALMAIVTIGALLGALLFFIAARRR